MPPETSPAAEPDGSPSTSAPTGPTVPTEPARPPARRRYLSADWAAVVVAAVVVVLAVAGLLPSIPFLVT